MEHERAAGAGRARTAPVPGTGRAAPFRPVAGLLVGSLVALLVAAVAIAAAADDLARGAFVTPDAVLVVHLVVLGVLPLGIAGAVLHVLPLLLRGVPRTDVAWAILALLAPGPLLAVAIARRHDLLAAVTGAVVGAGLLLLLAEAVRLAVTAPRGRIVVVSRVAVVACSVHAALSLALGPVLLARGWRPWAGVPHDRLIAIHLHLALVGAVTLLVVAVGRTLVPMLAVAPTAPRRRLPVAELVVIAGLWIGVGGLAAGSPWAVGVGGALVVGAVASFAGLAVRTLARRRVPAVEGPLLHGLAGSAFLVQAVVLGALLAGRTGDGALLTAYAVSLLLGWGTGVTLGHVGKLLAVSAWTWWPPGPRPRQTEFYDARAWWAVAGLFPGGTQLLVVAALVGSPLLARLGGIVLGIAAVTALVGATSTLAVRPERARAAGRSEAAPRA